MQFQWWLNIAGLATTAIAAFLMFLFAPRVTAYPDPANRIDSRLQAAGDSERRVADLRRRRSRLAVALLCVGLCLQLLAALAQLRHAEVPAGDEATATTAVPAGCESAKSAEECADILATTGKNPYAAYGVVGRAPSYGRQSSSVAATPRIESAARANTIAEGPSQQEPPAGTVFVAPSAMRTYAIGTTPFEQFGLDVAYGLVGGLRKGSTTQWKLVEYRIGIYDDIVQATYGADPIGQPIEPQDLARSASLICERAARWPTLAFARWTVELRFVHWDAGQLDSGPFTVRPSDCR